MHTGLGVRDTIPHGGRNPFPAGTQPRPTEMGCIHAFLAIFRSTKREAVDEAPWIFTRFSGISMFDRVIEDVFKML